MKRFASAGILAALFIGAFLASLPAAPVLSMLLRGGQAWSVADVRGSVWNGSAGRLRWQDRELGAARWSARPSLRHPGTLDVAVRTRGALSLDARLSAGPLHVHVGQLDARFPASLLQGTGVAGPLAPTRGDIHVSNASGLAGRDGLRALDADVDWLGAARKAISLRLHAPETVGRCLQGTLRDRGGPLAITGTFTAHGTAHRVRARVALRAEPAGAGTGIAGRIAGGGQPLRLDHGRLPADCGSEAALPAASTRARRTAATTRA